MSFAANLQQVTFKMIIKQIKLCVIVLVFINSAFSYGYRKKNNLKQVFGWNQIGYDFDGVQYTNNTDHENDPKGDVIHYDDEIAESRKFFIAYNNIPIGFEVYGDRVFVTVPRRRHGIPSTLNYVDYHANQKASTSPLLKPYPDAARSKQLVSVYRPRADGCGRLWMVDTGLIEVPGERRQLQPPAILVFDLTTDEQILRYELKTTDLVDERTPAGLTSITVDVSPSACDDAYAYINDLATEGLVVFSLKLRDSWRLQHPSFIHDDRAMNFTVAGNIINWKDGLFSIALSGSDANGGRKAYYHPLVSTQEFSVDTEVLKWKDGSLEAHVQLLGSRGKLAQSGSHAYHAVTRTILYANVAQDAITCWHVDSAMTPHNVPVLVQDRQKLVYISDLKIIGDEVWVLVNQIPRFIYSTLNASETNYYIHRGQVQDLIRGTACDRLQV